MLKTNRSTSNFQLPTSNLLVLPSIWLKVVLGKTFDYLIFAINFQCAMMEKEILENSGQPDNEDNLDQDTAFDNTAGLNDSETTEETAPEKAEEIERLKAQVTEFKEKYLRQVAEFDNFRKRNARERVELIQTAGKDVIASLLDVLDDCDRAQQQLEKSDNNSANEGVLLVFNKLRNTLYARGLKPMESIGQDFNPDLHEAVTEIPVPSSEMKGKVVDELQKGYYLNDKIIRFAKVVVGK
jgi:molecular chaperone GrpE